ncbi:hypothetical protein M514_04612 [Trichuris suis]|uniref:Uncharacterized protein n=1 Tax=Trichuris suis TaxID=68888 RepID=A0A085NV33_9BILA|nr:hypothetical protein M513_04612 [Trichuris suis]KFD73329.1 hypothetical protein M514_04612 [Trichuris suis]
MCRTDASVECTNEFDDSFERIGAFLPRQRLIFISFAMGKVLFFDGSLMEDSSKCWHVKVERLIAWPPTEGVKLAWRSEMRPGGGSKRADVVAGAAGSGALKADDRLMTVPLLWRWYH